MSIEELEFKHLHLLACNEDEPKEYAKLSVEYAISVLEKIGEEFLQSSNDDAWWYEAKIDKKIQELKQYLNE